MPNKILTAIGWQDRVRNKLGVDDVYLPDSIIEQPDYIDLAEGYVISHIPDYNTVSDETRVWLEAAVVAKCASLICPIMKVIVPIREQGPHFTRDLVYDWDKRRVELEEECEAHISIFDVGIGGPKGFSVHNG